MANPSVCFKEILVGRASISLRIEYRIKGFVIIEGTQFFESAQVFSLSVYKENKGGKT